MPVIGYVIGGIGLLLLMAHPKASKPAGVVGLFMILLGIMLIFVG